MNFDSFKSRSLRACRNGIACEEVAACGDPGLVWFVLFWAYRAHNVCVGDSLVLGNLLLGDKEDSIGAFDAAFEALGKAA